MRLAGAEFWLRFSQPDKYPPPSPDGSLASLAALKARFADPRKDKAAEVDGTLYAAWSDTRDLIRHYEDKARGYENELREQAGDAQVLTVDGIKVATRVVSRAEVKAHVRHQDYYRRVSKGEDNE